MIYSEQLRIVEILVLVLAAFRLGARFNLPTVCFTFWAIGVSLDLLHLHNGLPEKADFMYRLSVTWGLVWALLFLIVAAIWDEFVGKLCKATLAAAALLNGTWLIQDALRNPDRDPTAFLNNASMDSTFVALAGAYLFQVVRGRTLGTLSVGGLIMSAGVLSGSSNGIMCSALVTLGSFGLHFGFHQTFWPAMGGGILSVLLVPRAVWERLAWSNHRIEIWSQTYAFFVQEGRWFQGFGLGSFAGLGRYIQESAGKADPEGWMIFLHSDWLQVIFETGLVGFALCFGGFIALLVRGRKLDLNYDILALIAFAAASLANMPARYGPTALLGMVAVLSLSYKGK